MKTDHNRPRNGRGGGKSARRDDRSGGVEPKRADVARHATTPAAICAHTITVSVATPLVSMAVVVVEFQLF